MYMYMYMYMCMRKHAHRHVQAGMCKHAHHKHAYHKHVHRKQAHRKQAHRTGAPTSPAVRHDRLGLRALLRSRRVAVARAGVPLERILNLNAYTTMSGLCDDDDEMEQSADDGTHQSRARASGAGPTVPWASRVLPSRGAALHLQDAVATRGVAQVTPSATATAPLRSLHADSTFGAVTLSIVGAFDRTRLDHLVSRLRRRHRRTRARAGHPFHSDTA